MSTPEITASVTALADHQARIGAGVTLGSNVFNLAALLGLAAIVSGGIALHRRVIAMEAVVAVSIAAVAVLVVLGVVEPAVGLAASGSALGVRNCLGRGECTYYVVELRRCRA